MSEVIHKNEDVYKDLKNAITDMRAWCLIRFGDDEIRMIDENENNVLVLNKILKATFSMVHLFEYKKKINLKSIIANILIHCALETTWLGVHSQWDKCEIPGWRNTANVIKSINIPNYENKLCDMNFHSIFFNPANIDILYNRDQLTIITCRDLKERIEKFYSIKEVIQYRIDGEEPFREENTINNHFEIQYPELLNKIKSESRKGQLLLVGAGYLGKSYCVEWMKMGGIAVDIGSAFDVWAGYVTRGKGKGRGVRRDPKLPEI